MAIGDKEAAVTACVEAALKARGFNKPYDQDGTMDGRYKYQFETIIAFHRIVKGCLASKHYAYGYPESTEYLQQTLVMTLTRIEAEISARTGTAHFSTVLPADISFQMPSAAPKKAAGKKSKKTAKKKTYPKRAKRTALKKKARPATAGG
jgi:hypothetical protein